MQQATVGTKYQIVIPKEIRQQMKDILPGARVTIKRVDEDTLVIKTDPKSWLNRTRGMMKKAWKDIDTTKYLEDLRNEWDQKK